jgi:ABC-2 type transport system permease protein
MAAQFLRLKLRLLANSLRRSPWQVVGIILALLYGIGGAAFAIGSLIALRFSDAESAGTIVTILGSLLVLGYLVVPLAFGVDDTLDPRRFALFGMSTTKLASSLALAALVGVPSLVIIVIAIAQTATWSRGVLPELLALLSAAVIIVTCVLGARVTTSIAAFLLSSRRAREATGFTTMVVLVSLSPVVVFLASLDWNENGAAVLANIARVAGWTPLGAVWASPADAAVGSDGTALAKAAIGIAFAVVLWFSWRALVARMMVTPEREPQARHEQGLGWFVRMPDNPAGAIAARSLSYWFRDPRYRIALVMVPIVPVLLIIPLYTAGVPWQTLALIPVPVMCLFLTWSIHNDVAYDHTALWLHLASNTSGWADRFGRVIPALLIGVPLVLVGSPICAALFGDWDVLPSLFGLGFCILLVGLGLSSVMSAAFPYPAVHPGDGPFMQPQSSGTVAALAQSVSFFAIIVLSLPVVALAWLGFVWGGWWHLGALAAGLVIGLAAFFGGLTWGGRIFGKRAPELLAFMLRN